MTTVDLDVLIRDRAYRIWEQAGRPGGAEHLHWAEARWQIEHEHFLASVIVVDARAAEEPIPAEPETLRMRDALYRPEAFSFELFGRECPVTESTVVLFAKGARAAASGRSRPLERRPLPRP